jgi:MFS family permease
MKATLTQIGSFNRPVQLLLVNQLTINIGFYMLMPYLAGYLSNELALAAWTVGLILGMRNLSQQGMFLLGGSLADRIGYKPMILAGLGLRVIGFAMLGLVESLPALLIASALTGLAGALFNPAVRAYLAAEAGERKVEAFALFNVFYQTGILLGPLIGLALLGVAFRWVCLVAAVLFLLLLVAQARALPTRHSGQEKNRPQQSMLADWRQIARHRPFLLFSLAMIGSYVLNFQVYLGLPIEVRRVTGGEAGVAVLFAVSGLLTVVGQVRLTAWAKARWSPAQAIARGLLLMAAAFVPLALAATGPAPGPPQGWWAYAVALAPVLASTVLLTLATMIVYPFEMATIVELAADRTVGTYYGFYNTLAGIGIAAGNLLTGLALDAGRTHNVPALPWVALTLTGLLCATAITALDRRGHLRTGKQAAPTSREATGTRQ